MLAVGYSGKSLSQKLGIRPGEVVRSVNAPAHYRKLLEPLPPGSQIPETGEQAALVNSFVRSRDELNSWAARLVSLPRPGGSVWISWPKKSSSLLWI
ncbi:MAG TPA: hypothetical protein VII63_09085 [Caulobacteraceae bacterium]